MIGTRPESRLLGSQRVLNPQETVIFLHTPKTGGTTINGLLARIYPKSATFRTNDKQHQQSIEEFNALPPEDRNSFRLITGHMHLGVHESITNPCSYFTYLRDPIDRTISNYYYIQENKEHHLHAEIIESGYSLKEYLKRGALPTMSPNQLVKCLTGYHEKGFVPSRDTLELAKRNLDEHFSVVGLTELFDESLVLIADRYGWRRVWYSVRNVTRHRPGTNQFDPETIEAIKDYHKLDIELYEFARQRLEDQLRAFGPGLERKVKAIRARNWVHRKMDSARWRARRVTEYYRRLTRGRSE